MTDTNSISEIELKQPPADVAGEVTLKPQEITDDSTSPNNR